MGTSPPCIHMVNHTYLLSSVHIATSLKSKTKRKLHQHCRLCLRAELLKCTSDRLDVHNHFRKFRNQNKCLLHHPEGCSVESRSATSIRVIIPEQIDDIWTLRDKNKMNVDRDACMSEVGSDFPTKIFTVTLACRPTESFLVLCPFQIIRRFRFSK